MARRVCGVVVFAIALVGTAAPAPKRLQHADFGLHATKNIDAVDDEELPLNCVEIYANSRRMFEIVTLCADGDLLKVHTDRIGSAEELFLKHAHLAPIVQPIADAGNLATFLPAKLAAVERAFAFRINQQRRVDEGVSTRPLNLAWSEESHMLVDKALPDNGEHVFGEGGHPEKALRYPKNVLLCTIFVALILCTKSLMVEIFEDDDEVIFKVEDDDAPEEECLHNCAPKIWAEPLKSEKMTQGLDQHRWAEPPSPVGAPPAYWTQVKRL